LHNSIELETAVDDDLIGGFVLEFGDKRYDSSLSYQLQRLQKGFRDNAYERDI
jgi:F-type H+-transporting ATPase subunit delta